jgi:hypothetical protein
MYKNKRPGTILPALHFPRKECVISRLYHLELVGVRTSHVESIMSYTGRLASAHCLSVGNLVSKEIVPIIGKPWMIKERG